MGKIKLSKFPLHSRIGIFLVIIFWSLNWGLSGLRTQWGFFPLWLGYILTIDGIVFIRKDDSLFNRSKKLFISLFIISAPAWWIFEFFNEFMRNWHYDGKEYFTNLEYFLLSTLSFSTVMPAVFETTELITTFNFFDRFKKKNHFSVENKLVYKLIISGIIISLLVIFLPNYFYPFVWIAVFLIVDPINYKLNNRSLLEYFIKGNWQPLFNLAIGALICGFFWEMWNYLSYPKWIYYLPFVNIFHIFEMPAPGYIGYIPFSWELFALYHFIIGFFIKKEKQIYIKVTS